METKAKPGQKRRAVEASSGEIASAERYIVAGDDGRHYLVGLAGGKPLYIYEVEYDLSGYEIIAEAAPKCPKCGAPTSKVHIFRDAYGECEKGHIYHLGVIVSWPRRGAESEE